MVTVGVLVAVGMLVGVIAIAHRMVRNLAVLLDEWNREIQGPKKSLGGG
jgi:hypothetical protein